MKDSEIRVGNCIIKLTKNNVIPAGKDFNDEFYEAIAELLIKNNIELDMGND